MSSQINDAFGRPISTFYHAGIDGAGERERHQAAWSRGKVNIVCATIAFGACFQSVYVWPFCTLPMTGYNNRHRHLT